MGARPDFEQALKFGEDGERAVSRRLLRSGWVVTPLYQYVSHNSAPVAFLQEGPTMRHLTLPDLSMWSPAREAAFGEVKRKNRWVNYPPARVGKETGFNLRHFDEYLELQERTGVPMWMFFIHEREQPTGVFVQRLDVLARNVRRWDGRNDATGAYVTQPEALFPASLLQRWCGLDDVFDQAAAEEVCP